MRKHVGFWLYLGLVFVGSFLMSVAFPLTVDDLGWGSVSIQRYLSWQNITGPLGDGRFFGNTLIILLPHATWLLHLFYAGTMTALAYLVVRLTHQLWLAGGVMLLLLWLPRTVIAQTFGWNAGFINYVFALLFPLALLVMAQREVVENKPRHHHWTLVVLLGLWAVIAAWLNEPITLLSFLSLTAFIGVAKWRHQTLYAHWYAMWLGNGVGTAILLWKTARTTAASSAHYFSLGQLPSNIRLIFAVTFSQYLWLPIVIALTVCGLLWHQHRQLSARQLSVTVVAVLFIGIYVVSMLVWPQPRTLNFGLGTIALILEAGYWLVLVALTYLFLKDDLIAWYLVLASLFLILPFLLVQPFGERAVFGPQLMLILWWTRLWTTGLAIPRWLQVVVTGIAVGTVVFFATALVPIYQGKTAATRLIRYEAKTTMQPKYYLEIPNHDWWWNLHVSQRFDYLQQRFYGIRPYGPGILVPYATWKNMDTSDPAALIKILQANPNLK